MIFPSYQLIDSDDALTQRLNKIVLARKRTLHLNQNHRWSMAHTWIALSQDHLNTKERQWVDQSNARGKRGKKRQGKKSHSGGKKKRRK